MVANAIIVANKKIKTDDFPVRLTYPSIYVFPTNAPTKHVQTKVIAYCHGTNPLVMYNTATELDVNTIIVAVVAVDTRGYIPITSINGPTYDKIIQISKKNTIYGKI